MLSLWQVSRKPVNFLLSTLPIKTGTNDIECLKVKKKYKMLFKCLKLLYFYIDQPNSNKTYYLKQNDTIHYVTYVTFCITTYSL